MRQLKNNNNKPTFPHFGGTHSLQILQRHKLNSPSQPLPPYFLVQIKGCSASTDSALGNICPPSQSLGWNQASYFVHRLHKIPPMWIKNFKKLKSFFYKTVSLSEKLHQAQIEEQEVWPTLSNSDYLHYRLLVCPNYV